MEDLTGRQFGAYTIIGPLGEGGMASVYKAHQPAANRDVALKILGRHFMADPEFITRFKHEAWAVAQFQHPHILPVFDFGDSGGLTYLVMPFVKGGQLADLMDGTPMRLEMVDRVIRQICDALDYAHSKGVIHRDIKPSNVLIDERGNCLVADFGIARMTEGTAKLTATGTVVGTPTYMSPEQAAGETVGPQSDIYSLGIVLYEMVAGRVPFKAETPFAIALKHLSAPMPPPGTFNPRLGPAIEAVVLKALARSPADRYASGEEFANALSAAIRVTQSIQGKATIVQPRAAVQKPTDHTAPTVAAAPRTVPIAPKKDVPKAAPPIPVAPRRSRVPLLLAIGIPLLAIAAYAGFAGRAQTPRVPQTAPPVQTPSPAAVAAEPEPARAPTVVSPTPKPADPEPPPPAAAPAPEANRRADVGEAAGKGAPPVAFLQRACEEGRGAACLNLARMFESGRGVPQDDARALRLVRRACELGEQRGCAALKARFGRRGR